MDWLLLPFQLGLLVILHSIFALCRLAHVLSHIPLIFTQSLGPLTGPTPTTSPIEVDRKRWNKTPNHLAVILVPGMELRSWVWGTRVDHDRREAIRLQTELFQMLGWAKTLGLSSLSVYDRRGLLAQHAHTLASELGNTSTPALTLTKGCATFTLPTLATRPGKASDLLPSNEADSGHGGSDGIDARTATPPPDATVPKAATLTIHLLSREAGRPRLAQLVRELAREQLSREGPVGKGGVSVDVVGERVDGKPSPTAPRLAPAALLSARGLGGVRLGPGREPSVRLTGHVEFFWGAALLPEPDLLLVQGGPYLRLNGFPPWQLRLTEISYVPFSPVGALAACTPGKLGSALTSLFHSGLSLSQPSFIPIVAACAPNHVSDPA